MNRFAPRAARWSQIYAAVCLAAAIGAAPLLDRLSAVLIVLSAFLFAVVCRYAARYMDGDAAQTRFSGWLCLTGTCVFALVLADNLLWFALAWCGISLSLHQLLQLYPHRPGALLAARKKFLISRVGDAALAAALLLTYSAYGTLDFQAVFAAAGTPGPVASWTGFLLAFAAILKSAQFPFHSWLPDTMETPTPVSALMHAGIINAGGILVIRLSPLIVESEPAMLLLTVTGAFTALFASVVMLTQASVKRCLAFSTVAQMGFMMLECGLGAFHLALLHLVAHSLYKAHAFLSSGSVVNTKAARPAAGAGALTLGAGLVLAAAATYVTASWLGVTPLGHTVLTGIFAIALAQLYWAAPGPVGALLTLGAGAAYFALHRAAEWVVPAGTHPDLPWLAAPILAAFLAVALLQFQLPRLARQEWLRPLYVHARNGFYFNTLANRFTTALWPVKSTQGNY